MIETDYTTVEVAQTAEEGEELTRAALVRADMLGIDDRRDALCGECIECGTRVKIQATTDRYVLAPRMLKTSTGEEHPWALIQSMCPNAECGWIGAMSYMRKGEVHPDTDEVVEESCFTLVTARNIHKLYNGYYEGD